MRFKPVSGRPLVLRSKIYAHQNLKRPNFGSVMFVIKGDLLLFALRVGRVNLLSYTIEE